MGQPVSRLQIPLLALSLIACTRLPNQAITVGTITVNFGSLAAPRTTGTLQTQAFDVADVVQANVSVSGPSIATPIACPLNPIGTPNGQAGGTMQMSVPAGRNRIVTAQALDRQGQQLAPWLAIKGLVDVNAGSNPPMTVTWSTTPAATVVESLLTAGSPFAATVNASQLQQLVDQITVPTTSGGTTTYAVHPSLVNGAAIAAAIIANAGAVPGAPPPGAVTAPGSISGTVTGLSHNETATVVANDPASAPVTTDAAGHYVLSGVTPLPGVSVTARNRFMDDGSAVTSVTSNQVSALTIAPAPMHYIDKDFGTDGWGRPIAIRWTRMPIQVLIVKPSNPAAIHWQQGHLDAMRNAVSVWEHQLGDIMSFNVTETMDNDPAITAKIAASDIHIVWLDTLWGNNGGLCWDSYSYCYSCTPRSLNLHKRIEIGTYGGQWDYSVWAQTSVHEFGHGLGSGHSDSQTDIMGGTWSLILNFPSPIDLKTIRFLYALPADITKLP
jgi:predicted Zn-dependent protease